MRHRNQNEHDKRFYKKRKAVGVCIKCTRPVSRGSIRCEVHKMKEKITCAKASIASRLGTSTEIIPSELAALVALLQNTGVREQWTRLVRQGRSTRRG